MAEAEALRHAAAGYRDIAAMWMRATMSYRASFWMLSISGFFITGLDAVGIWVMFRSVDRLGGFGLREIAFLYGATGLGLAVGDLLIGRIERLGQMVRTGHLDSMLVRPLPLIVQVCADEFTLRRLARVLQTGLVFTWGAGAIHWTPGRALLTLLMLVSSAVIFSALIVAFASVQFWTSESAELGSAFTYGGNALTQYPLTIYPRELVLALTFLLPLAFVNWYPALHLLGREDPFGLPAVLQVLSPVAAVATTAIATVVWRSGVRHYESTGS